MNTAAEVQTFGNPNLPDPTPDRPLVTFALFAYNQEKYIREAVEGAFSQTYEPLEIILSDDCSSDRTFEIMQEMAAAYKGPHQVNVLQTEVNLGVTRHVLLRGQEARGEIVVVAAGDDISKPERCDYHVQVYKDASVMGVSGGYNLIDESGNEISSAIFKPLIKRAALTQPRFFSRLTYPYVVIQGSTASYRKSIFDFEFPDRDLGSSEDNLFNFLIYAHGFRVALLQVSLVKYRVHSGAISNHGSRHLGNVNMCPEETEANIRSDNAKHICKMQTFKWISDNTADASRVDFLEIERQESKSQEVLDWTDLGFQARFLSALHSIASIDAKMVKWKLLRLFGRFPKYQPKLFTARFCRK